MSLTEWARHQGIHLETAYNWFHAGTLPVPAVRVNQRIIWVSPDNALSSPTQSLGLHARVPSHDQRADLDRQVARLLEWVARTGQPVVRVESEVGSGMNGSWTKLRRLLAGPKVTTVVVDAGEVEDYLVRDMTEVLRSFCSRLYGRQVARNRAMEGVEHDVGPIWPWPNSPVPSRCHSRRGRWRSEQAPSPIDYPSVCGSTFEWCQGADPARRERKRALTAAGSSRWPKRSPGRVRTPSGLPGATCLSRSGALGPASPA